MRRKSEKEDVLEKDAELLRRLRSTPVTTVLTLAGRDRLLKDLGTSTENVDELLSLDIEEE